MSEGERVMTKAALMRKSQPVVEVVVHESRKKKAPSAASAVKESNEKPGKKFNDKKNDPTSELNMKRTRFEVMKFAMAGYKSQEKQDAKVALAIELGAIPPKKKYINYKVLMEQKKAETLEAEEAEKMQLLGKKVKKSKQSQFTGGSFRRGRGGILGQYGRVSKVII